MFFVMKVSKLCNLRCTYCYEYDELSHSDRMPLDGLATFFDSVAAYYQAQGWRHRLVFVLHGGEPLLLPNDYLRTFCDALRSSLGSAGVPYRVSVQTNLTRLDRAQIEFLEDLDVSLGVSIDVFGAERVDRRGQDSLKRALANLQLLSDAGGIESLRVGAISVLHRGNIDLAVNVFRFYRDLGLSYRALPIFSLGEPPPRMRHLTLEPERVLQAFKAIADEQFREPSGIVVYPLANYFDAAVSELAGIERPTYDPRQAEWALIVNTNGDVYNHGESYSPTGLMGNIFRHGLSEVMDGPARQRTLDLRLERATTCLSCPHGHTCSRLPVMEALPSERFTDPDGQLECAIARPMIDFMVERIRSSPDAMDLISRWMPPADAELAEI